MQHCLLSFTVQLTKWFYPECFFSLIKTQGLVMLEMSNLDAKLSNDKKISQYSVSNNLKPCLTVNVTEIENQTTVLRQIHL